MARRDINPNSHLEEVVLISSLAGMLLVVLGGAWSSLHLAARIDSDPAPTRNPAGLFIELGTGKQPWTPTTTWVAIGFALVLLIVIVAVALVWARVVGRRQRPDRAARHLASIKDISHLTQRGAAGKARRLGVGSDAPGVPLGRKVPSGTRLFGSWEDMIVVVAGPRTMKTTAYAIPSVMAAPGAALVTSNKRDVVDATRQPRSALGRAWVFDPQHVVNEPATWWWNPLTYIAPVDPGTERVLRDPRTGWVQADEVRAEKLAGQFVASTVVRGAQTDAYFDAEAENLIGLLLLAAACGERALTDVYSWLTHPVDEDPVELLEFNGFRLQHEALYALSHLPEKQRDGVYGTARARMGFLRNRRMVEWVTPPTGFKEQLHPAQFAQSTDTLYLLSREGEGSAGPLVAALTVAVIDELQELATASPGGRLVVPFLAVLDEAANICRFRNLDSYYSFFGSHGIIIETILQNWAQGEEVWGTKGMEKLWSAANIKIYGGGVDDDKFLRRISDLVGQYSHMSHTENYGGRSGRGRSRSVQERTILTIGELRELPSAGKDGRGGRAIAFASGAPAILVEPQPWWIGPDQDVIIASLAAHTPRVEAGVR